MTEEERENETIKRRGGDATSERKLAASDTDVVRD